MIASPISNFLNHFDNSVGYSHFYRRDVSAGAEQRGIFVDKTPNTGEIHLVS